jgi:hypothetical protein
MRKTRTKTKRKPSGATRKNKGGATRSPPQYLIRAAGLHDEIQNQMDIGDATYNRLTQHINQPENNQAIHQFIRRHRNIFQHGLDLTVRPIVTYRGNIIVARFPSTIGGVYTPLLLRRTSSSSSRSDSPNPASDSD